MKLRVTTIIFATCFCALGILISCGQKKPLRYTYGPLSQTGTIVAANVSLVRRGTHMLKVGDQEIYYLESKTENLQDYNGQNVFVEGELQPNTHEKYLPVLVVRSLHGNKRETEDKLHEWNIPALGIVLTTPDSWVAQIKNDVATFSSGSGQSIMTITRKEGTRLPKGEGMFIDGGKAVRVSSQQDGPQDVYVADDTHTIRLHFTPDDAMTDDKVRVQLLLRQFNDAIASLRWKDSQTGTQASGGAMTGTGTSASGMPCGGSAGILCPSGSYCDVYDAEESIGKCKQI